ncbi:hypothetical protein CVD28_24490 [Bacillus sp. M6-12]|uniref:single-stranded DNA-binding protein n=1 Tax=Bacillus sp. M6-12 TaxID=2054166 RepID=UPI000C75C5EC|nr:single-stranded DNA-binding protein [Bacillus sp. M6-12]PLS15042.1 hypothetical protein CVD28_24490 [Bacillus sp. M6-12]
MINKVKVVGVSTGVFEVNHSFKGANDKIITALETEIRFTSANSISNTIKVIVFKDSIFERILSQKDKLVVIEGMLRTFNKNSWGKRIKEVFVAPVSVRNARPDTKQQNVVQITGEIIGKTNLKERTSGRFVAEGQVKVKRNGTGFDFIPVVAFDDYAKLLNKAEEGTEITLKGRIHSRAFDFKYEENGEEKEVKRIALEVGVHKLEVEAKEDVQNEKDTKLGLQLGYRRIDKQHYNLVSSMMDNDYELVARKSSKGKYPVHLLKTGTFHYLDSVIKAKRMVNMNYM